MSLAYDLEQFEASTHIVKGGSGVCLCQKKAIKVGVGQKTSELHGYQAIYSKRQRLNFAQCSTRGSAIVHT